MQIWKTTLLTCAIAAALGGCSTKSPTAAVVIEDRMYPLTPAAMTVKTGIVTAQLSEMKVTERVEKGSGRVDTPAKLTAKLKLTNASSDQTVRLISGKLLYLDTQGQPIKVEEARIEPVMRFSSMSSSQLDPGQDTSQSIDVDFPTAALKGKKLGRIRLDIVYAPTAYRQETASVAISLGGS